jgi:PAS domain S-box-containing protein/putative nucleotidyltransferase with HDIG domain
VYILYLEDNPDDALLTQHALSKAVPPINVDVAHTLSDAYKLLEESASKYDLVLSDLNLPDGSGFSLLSFIRSRKMPQAVVVVTGQSDEDKATAALKAGADDYIPKKEDYLSRLPSTLNSALERHHAEIALHSRALRVLYAESNLDDIESTRQHIGNHAAHIQLEFVSNVESLSTILNRDDLRDEYDVLVLDYLLPDFNAMEALKVLFEDRKVDTPIILITRQGSEDIVSQALKLGASDYIVKNPGYLFKLPAVIENAFHRTELIREQAALRAAETRYRVLVEQSPAASYIDAVDNSSSTIFISNRIEDVFGYPVSAWVNDKDFWLSILSPDDRDRVIEEHVRTNLTLEPFRMEYRMIANDGRMVWVRDEAIIVLDDEGNPHHWQGLLINITEQKQAEEALRRRDAIMEAISLAAERFLVVSWQENIQTILGQLGQAAGVSRAYIFQNRISNDRIVSDQIYEWAAPGIIPQAGNPEMTGFDFEDAGFERWIPLMSEGHPIFGVVNQMNPGERKIFTSQGILSIACMPIFVNKAWWGFIGFDDCAEERNWRPAEIDALKTSANILGAAIQRLDSEYALQRQLNELTVLQSVSAAGMQSNKVDDLITITTQILANILYPENCGVYLFDEIANELTPHRSYHRVDGTLASESAPASQGVVGTVFSKNKPLLVPDPNKFQDDPSINPDIKSVMAVPLHIGERTIGVLTVQSRQSTSYSEVDLHLLTTIAGQLSIAMEKIHLLENEHRRLQESETLRQAASIISTSLDLELVLDTILSSVKKVVPYDSASIFLSENESPALHVVAAQGFTNNSTILQKTVPEPGRLLREVFEKRQIVIIDDVQKDDRFEMWEPELVNIHGWMGVPLISRDEVIGYLTLDSLKPHAYTTSNAVLAQTFAYQAAAAISNASLYEETRRRLRELEVINRISSTLRSSITEEQMLPGLLSETLQALGTTSGSIWLCDNTTGQIRQSASMGWFTGIRVPQVNKDEGLAGYIFKSEKPYFVLDFSNEETIPEDHRDSYSKGWSGAGIPIRTSTDMIGVFIVAVRHPRQFSRNEFNLLETIAEMAGNAIHRARLYAHSEQQVNRLTALRDVDIAISSSFDLRTTLDVIIDHVVNQLGVDAARILLYNPYTQTLDLSVTRGFRSISKMDLHQRLSESLAGNSALENRMIVLPDIRESDAVPDNFRQEGFLSYFNVPLNAKGQIKGILEVFMRHFYSPAPDWLEFLSSLGGQTAIAIDNAQLFTNLQRSNVELELAYDTTLEGWGKALEIRDQETEGHTQRVTEMTLKLARRLGFNGDDLIQIRRGALLHDIGKMGIPDEILRKPGTLSEQEWVIMRKHVDFAYTLLNPINYLQKALDIPYCHHERWNGNGYPRGLKEEEIPVSARIFALVDVWDALLSDRPYRSAWARDKVIEYIKEQSGIQFDPRLTGIFMELVDAGEMD